MAEPQDSVTTVQETDEPKTQRKGRFGRGRRKKDDEHGATEWVDTLHAAEEADDDAVSPTGSPFDMGSDPAADLPEAPDDAADDSEPVAARPALELPHTDMGDEPASDAEEISYERSWKRRHHEGMDDIHHFVDHVIGTSLDPARRRRMGSREVGLSDTRPAPAPQSTTVRVDGLDEEFLIAFTFPESEFRGAHVVYETEGGYVLDVRRAIGGNDDDITSHYYTVSRMGEVSHVIDKLRERDDAMRSSELRRMARDHGRDVGTETTTTTRRTVTESHYESHTEALSESLAELPEAEPEAMEPTPQPAEPTPEAAPPAPQVPAAPAFAASDADRAAPQVEVGAPAADAGTDAATVDDGAEEAPAKKRFSLRRKKSASEDEESGAEPAGEVGADPASEADPGDNKKRGIFRFKKGADGESED